MVKIKVTDNDMNNEIVRLSKKDISKYYSEPFIFEEYEFIYTTKYMGHDIECIYSVNKDYIKLTIPVVQINNGIMKTIKIEGKFKVVCTEENGDTVYLPEAVDLFRSSMYKYYNKKYGWKKAKEHCYAIFNEYFERIVNNRRYIMNKLEERQKTIKEAKKIKSNSKHRKSNKKYEKKEIYLINELIEYVSHSNRHHVITCEAWTVRGHYRHYKNGKVVFIQSYNKGKYKDRKVDKVYTLGD